MTIQDINIEFSESANSHSYTLTRGSTEYTGSIRWISNNKRKFSRLFQLTPEEAEKLLWRILHRYQDWYHSRRKSNAPYVVKE